MLKKIGLASLVTVLYLGLCFTIVAAAYQCSPASSIRQQYHYFQLERARTRGMIEDGLRHESNPPRDIRV